MAWSLVTGFLFWLCTTEHAYDDVFSGLKEAPVVMNHLDFEGCTGLQLCGQGVSCCQKFNFVGCVGGEVALLSSVRIRSVRLEEASGWVLSGLARSRPSCTVGSVRELKNHM